MDNGYKLLARRTGYSLTQGAVSCHKQPHTWGPRLAMTMCFSRQMSKARLPFVFRANGLESVNLEKATRAFRLHQTQFPF